MIYLVSIGMPLTKITLSNLVLLMDNCESDTNEESHNRYLEKLLKETAAQSHLDTLIRMKLLEMMYLH